MLLLILLTSALLLIWNEPDVGPIIPVIIDIVVVLPAPLCPSNAVTCPDKVIIRSVKKFTKEIYQRSYRNVFFISPLIICICILYIYLSLYNISILLPYNVINGRL